MSNAATLAQQPEIIIPNVPSLTEIHPNNLSLNIFDSIRRSNTITDRQDQPNYNPGPDFPDSAPNYTAHPGTGKHDFKCKVYRTLVGKHFCEYKKEKKNKKQRRTDFFINELRYHLAEFVGTFFLVFFICGIQINQDLFSNGGLSNVDKGLASGFILTGLIYSFGKVSGAHFNPCVTLAFLFRGSFGFFRSITYIIAQFAGAVSGAAVLYHLFGNVGGLGTTVPGNGISGRVACEIEILMTYTLITVILTTTKKAQLLSAIAGLAVGSTFAAIELLAWNYTGASVNPWRTIGPTLISGVGWDTYWVYIVGPICGTILAVFVERIMAIGAKPRKKEKPYKEEKRSGEKAD